MQYIIIFLIIILTLFYIGFIFKCYCKNYIYNEYPSNSSNPSNPSAISPSQDEIIINNTQENVIETLTTTIIPQSKDEIIIDNTQADIIETSTTTIIQKLKYPDEAMPVIISIPPKTQWSPHTPRVESPSHPIKKTSFVKIYVV